MNVLYSLRNFATRWGAWFGGGVAVLVLAFVFLSGGDEQSSSGTSVFVATTNSAGTQSTLPGGAVLPTTANVNDQITFEPLSEQISFPRGGANVLQQNGPSAEQVEKLRLALGSGAVKESSTGWEGDGLVVLKTGSFTYENHRQQDPGVLVGCNPGLPCVPKGGSTIPAPSAGLPSPEVMEKTAQGVLSVLGAPAVIDTRIRDQWRGYVRASVRAETTDIGFAVVVIGDNNVVLSASGPIGSWEAGREFGMPSAKDAYQSIKNAGELIRKGVRNVAVGESTSMVNAYRCGATRTKDGVTEVLPGWCFQDMYGNVWRVAGNDVGVPFADNPQDGYNLDTTPGTTTPEGEEVSNSD
jgi:hypothetical protein